MYVAMRGSQLAREGLRGNEQIQAAGTRMQGCVLLCSLCLCPNHQACILRDAAQCGANERLHADTG